VSPRDADFHVLADGTRLPRVTAILKAAFPFANLNWAAYLARDNTRRFARQVYDAVHPVTGVCLGLDGESFDNTLAQIQGNAPPHELGQDAAAVGTAVHGYAEAVMRTRMGQNVRIPQLPQHELVAGARVASRHMNAVESFHAWLDKHNVRATSAETRLVSRIHGYTGTTDLFADVDDVFSVIDFKTSKGIFKEYPLQIAAYAIAAIEMGLAAAPVQGLIVRFPKEAGDEFEVATYSWDEIEGYLFPVFRDVCLGSWKYQQWYAERHPYKRRPR
jgi:hypothetical protein